MKRATVERIVVVVLFISVLVVFTLAQKDTRKFDALYTGLSEKVQTILSHLK